MIGELYALESKLKAAWSDKLTADAVKAIQQTRQEQSLAICNRYFQFCKTNKNRSTGNLRKAMEYSLNEEQKLRHYLTNVACEM